MFVAGSLLLYFLCSPAEAFWARNSRGALDEAFWPSEQLGIVPGTYGHFSLDAPAAPSRPLRRARVSAEEGRLLDEEARVARLVEEVRARLLAAGLRPGAGRAQLGGLREKMRAMGDEEWEKATPVRQSIENQLVADKKQGEFGTKIFFEHVTHSGGTEFCDHIFRKNEPIVAPDSNCLHIPSADAHWTESRWQIGKTGAESVKYVKEHGLTPNWRVIANEQLMPADPSFDSQFLYLSVLRNPYSRHMTDVKRHHDNFSHVGKFNKIPLDNYETRHFCGEPCREIPFGGLNDGHLHMAMRNLAHFSFVGPTEYLACFQTLNNKLSWDISSWRGKLTDLTQDTREAADALQQLVRDGNTDVFQDFLAMHAYDELLYDYAKQICQRLLNEG